MTQHQKVEKKFKIKYYSVICEKIPKKTITKGYLIYKIKLESKVINKIKAWIIIIIIIIIIIRIIIKMGVSHYGLAISIKIYRKAKEEL
jgi:hypothetical protein